MNNQELELKIKEILANKNFFDMIEAAATFEKEYKTTDFFKKTKMPLMDVIKNSKNWYILQFNNIVDQLQELIDGLNFDNVNNILNQFGDLYQQENEDTISILKEFRELVK